MRAWMLCAWACVLAAGLSGCNSAPRAGDDMAGVPAGATTTINVLANDQDPDGDPMIVRQAWGAKQGSLTVNPDNTISYSAYPDARGTDEFSYKVGDGRGGTSTATVRVGLDEPVALAPQERVILATPEPMIFPETRIIERERVIVPQTVIVPERPSGIVVMPAPPPAPVLQRVLVTLQTKEDDKNREDGVRIRMLRGDQVVAESTVGDGELWGSGTTRAFELTLSEPIPLDKISELTLNIAKTPADGAGGGWVFTPELLGRTQDGTIVNLLGAGESVKLGDREPSQVSIRIPVR